MKTLFEISPWELVENQIHKEDMRLSESLTSIGNGYMGMRGNFEEHYSGDTLKGTYIGGVWFPDKTRVGWWKNGYPKYFGKAINAVDLIQIGVSVDGEEIDLAKLEVLDFRRTLDMKNGVLKRSATVRTAKGKVTINSERFLSVVKKEMLGIKYELSTDYDCHVSFSPAIDSNVNNEDSNYDESFWDFLEEKANDSSGYVVAKTKENPFDVPRFTVCAKMENILNCKFSVSTKTGKGRAECKFDFDLKQNEKVQLIKLVAVTTSRDFEESDLTHKAQEILNSASKLGYDELLSEHKKAWNKRWGKADVTIKGDDAAQQGIRFNMFELFCTYYGDDSRLNFGPKGFTGEKYGGATYWDTEAYCLPMYLSVADPEVSRNLLLYRYNQIDEAYENAREQGLDGALYPMVTFNGLECHNEWEITFEEIHRNSAIAFAIYNYVNYTGDKDYLVKYGIDVLAGIAKFWADRVHFSKQRYKYVIHGVTGPNEYENNINNNFYTNLMAKWCLEYTASVAKNEAKSRAKELGLTDAVLSNFEKIAENMYLGKDEKLGVFIAHDGFMDKDLMNVDKLRASDRPINQNWSWDKILRSCFIKQADTLQGLYTLGYLFDKKTKETNFKFYEPMTVHESSLSPCVHSILACEIGLKEKAVEMYQRTARLDLDNINNDTEDGCHITSMSGSWLSIAQGFAGMRTHDGLSFAPFVPSCWDSFSFKINYRGRNIEISTAIDKVEIKLLSGEPLDITLYNQKHRLENVIIEKTKE